MSLQRIHKGFTRKYTEEDIHFLVHTSEIHEKSFWSGSDHEQSILMGIGPKLLEMVLAVILMNKTIDGEINA
uniref:Uncharacterized protein n=1 Tax=Candidatus Kentrum sp. SD TaxID=2126332 RepID=A0A451BK23_9GAMM|nr:MAG: hypothetical protein BECKSD772D_GA0070982_102028 [Candidatus Kentron sp. SD]